MVKEGSIDMEETIEINGISYRLDILIEKRRNSRASVSRKGIVIRIPHFLGRQERERQIEEFSKWATKRIMKNPERFSPEKPIIYNDGQKIRSIGEEYFLRINTGNKAKTTLKMSGNNITVSVPGNLEQEQQSRIIGKVLNKKLSSVFYDKIKSKVYDINSKFFRRHIKSVRLKNNKSTWGSCSPGGDITISSRLLLAPLEILDYVIVHELSHLVVRGHSKKFWSVVEKAVPDYREKRKWLRKNGDSLRF